MKRLLAITALLILAACLSPVRDVQPGPTKLRVEGFDDICFTSATGVRACIPRGNIIHTRSAEYVDCSDCSFIFVRDYRYVLNMPHEELRAFLR